MSERRAVSPNDARLQKLAPTHPLMSLFESGGDLLERLVDRLPGTPENVVEKLTANYFCG